MPLPVLKSKVFGRDEFEALMASSPHARGWEIPIDRATSVMMEKGRTRNVLFVRRLKPWPKADVQKDYVRVWVHDVNGTLRTTAKTPKLRAFMDEIARKIAPRLRKTLREREKRVARAIANAPKIDREALADAVRAMTQGRRVDEIVDAVMLATTDPRAYLRANERACADYGIFEPIEGLHVIALLQHLPEERLLYFDWKESMHEVLPMIARMVPFDTKPLERKCDAWDRRDRMKALEEIAPFVAKKGVVLVNIDTHSDAFSVVCVRREDAKRIATWRRKAHLPLKAITSASRPTRTSR